MTLVQSVPFTVGLIASIADARSGFPGWLWISYGALFVGELRAWWVPHLLRPEPVCAARYRVMFGGTHACLPERNGIVPNTLHVVLHACTAATLILLAELTFEAACD